MTLQIKAPPHKRGGAGARLPDRAKETSGVSVAEKILSDNPPLTFNGHRFLCFFKQEPIYTGSGNPSYLCFLREETLVAPTSEELSELSHSRLPYCFPKLRDKLLSAALAAEELEEAQREKLEETRLEESLSEIGHGQTYNWPHLPVVI